MLVGSGAGEDEVGVAVDQPGRDPAASERIHPLGAKSRELGALSDADDLAVGNADRAILDEAERVAGRVLEGRNVAVDEQTVPHARRLRRALLLASKRWRAGPTFPSWFQAMRAMRPSVSWGRRL